MRSAISEKKEAQAKAGDLRVLILEDMETDADLMKYELESAGIRFVARRVETRDDFIHELGEFSPNLILADYSLPSFDGMSALTIVRRQRPDLPFIFVSGAMGEERAIELLREGATDYILKDRLSRLPSAILRALQEAKARAERAAAEEVLRKAHAELTSLNRDLQREIAKRDRVEAELRNYHARLRSLTSELTLAEERERRRIATELHEGIGQTLAIFKLRIEQFRESAPQKSQKPLGDILGLVEEAIRDTRSLTRELSPPVFQFGFADSIEWLIEQMGERYGLRIELETEDGIVSPEPDFQILLYQSTRELLMNSIKHARAKSIRVRLEMEMNQVKVQVTDNGVGFRTVPANGADGSPETAMEGFGLFSIRERLKHIGGQMEIESEEGRGTCITLLAPCARMQERRRATDKLMI